jgi:ABC-type Fe3+-hydroxamate transport system substrate-binding protein
MLKSILVCSLSIVLFAALAIAHGDATHLMGTVTAVTADTVTIKDSAGKSVVVMLPKTTKFLQNKKAVAKDDLKLGARVVIDAEMDAKMKMYSAEEVQIGAAPAAEKKAK